MDEDGVVESTDMLRFSVLGRADVVEGRPAVSVGLLDSESNAVALALGDMNVLILAISRSLLC